MIIKKLIIIGILTTSLLLPVTVVAEQMDIVNSEYEISSLEENGMRSSDHIEYYYRLKDGVLQYRRWNATRGYWIDATWLNVPEE